MQLLTAQRASAIVNQSRAGYATSTQRRVHHCACKQAGLPAERTGKIAELIVDWIVDRDGVQENYTYAWPAHYML